MTEKANLISSPLSALEKLTVTDVSRLMAIMDDDGLSRIIITDTDGISVFDNSVVDNVTGKYILLPEVYHALSGSDSFFGAYNDNAFESRVAVPVILRGRIIGSVYLYERDEEQAAFLNGIASTILNLSIIVSLFVILLSVFFSSLMTRRISSLLDAIRKVGEGKYDYNAPVSGRDELAELANEFNRLVERINITEEMRRRFVSDASHELKTPLASMRLLTDSILGTENMDRDLLREFISDIGDEIDRLTRTTEKLLSLTKLDAEVQDKREEVDIKNVVLKAAHMIEPIADNNGVVLKLEMEDGCAIVANEDDIYQIVFNIMENAVKYNYPGGMVNVYLYKKDEKVYLLIDDTGIGIPEEDLVHVFERFYRVDKARSREAGGSGLGLSIAQDNVKRYGGIITAERRESGGTRFAVIFPVKERTSQDED